MNHRLIVRLVALMIFLSMLISCSNVPVDERIEITLMHGWGDSTPNHIGMRQIYKDFEIAHPDIKLNFDSSPDLSVVIDKANDKLAANKMPDIISTNGASQFLSNAIIRHKALNLKPYIDEDEEFQQDIHPAILKAWLKEDEIYTLPDALEVIGYWYNEELLRQAGVTFDSTPYTEVKLPMTWEEFWIACDKVEKWSVEQQNNVKPIMLEDDQSLIFLGARIAGESNKGADLLSELLLEPDSAELDIALKDLRQGYSYTEGNIVSRKDVLQAFKKGQIALFLGGVWDSDEFSNMQQSDSIKYAVFPGYDGENVAYISASSGYVIGNTGDPRKIEACVKFLKYMLSDEVQQRIVVESKQAPSNPHVNIEWIQANVPMLGSALETAMKANIQIQTLDSLYDEATIVMVKKNMKASIAEEK